jgi:hypothetical protein
VKGIFDTKANSGYDDEITRRYHFPPQYRAVAERLVGDWIIYRGRNATAAVAHTLRLQGYCGSTSIPLTPVTPTQLWETIYPSIGPFHSQPAAVTPKRL